MIPRNMTDAELRSLRGRLNAELSARSPASATAAARRRLCECGICTRCRHRENMAKWRARVRKTKEKKWKHYYEIGDFVCGQHRPTKGGGQFDYPPTAHYAQPAAPAASPDGSAMRCSALEPCG